MAKYVSEIFEKRPDQWFLRGEPFLWDDLEKLYSQFNLPMSIDHFEDILNEFLTGLLKEAEYKNGIIFVERYAQGGMSSGCVSLIEWELKRRPQLIERLEKANREIKGH